MSFFSILSFPFKWQNKVESLISPQKNMSIWEMRRNKTAFELFAFEAPFMSSFCVSASVTRASSPNFVVGRTKSPCFWLCTHLCYWVCVWVGMHVYQPVPVIGLYEHPVHVGYLVYLDDKHISLRSVGWELWHWNGIMLQLGKINSASGKLLLHVFLW